MTDGERSVVLVVEPDWTESGRVGGWLEQEGFEVQLCPGPRAPAYRCVGARLGRCPLAHSADAVVLDLHLETDDVMEGTSASDLIGLYTSLGLPVVTYGPSTSVAHPFTEAGVVPVSWPPIRSELVDAVRSAVGGRPGR